MHFLGKLGSNSLFSLPNPPLSTTIFDTGLARAFCGVRLLPTLVLLALGFIRAAPPLFIWVTVDIIVRSGQGVISNVDAPRRADLPVVIESPIIDIWSKVPHGLLPTPTSNS
jgi:hypothetical protein